MVTTPERPVKGAAAVAAGDPYDRALSEMQGQADLHSVPLLLRMPPELRLTDDALAALAEANDLLWFERTAEGNLIISPAPKGNSSAISTEISFQIKLWIRDGGGGEVRDGTGGFGFGPTPPPGSSERQAELMPDLSWFPQEVRDGIDRETYLRGNLKFAPPLVVEIRSGAQRLTPLKRKLEAYRAYGVKLGWLIDPLERQVWIYRIGDAEPDLLDHPARLSGEDVLVGFELDCNEFWI